MVVSSSGQPWKHGRKGWCLSDVAADETPLSINSRPFLISRVCGNSEPNTSVPIMAYVHVARSHTRMRISVCSPMNDTTQWEHPDTPILVPFAPRNVLEVHPNAPTGAPARTSVWHRESDTAVTDDPESTRNSTEWSPIHPSRNQCPAPEICSTESSTWSAYKESGRSISEPVCVVSTGMVSSRSRTISSPSYGSTGRFSNALIQEQNRIPDDWIIFMIRVYDVWVSPMMRVYDLWVLGL